MILLSNKKSIAGVDKPLFHIPYSIFSFFILLPIFFILFSIFLFPAPKAQASVVGQSNTVALTRGLVGYWTFDGKDTPWTSATAATTLDKSGQGNTGTLTSMNQSTAPVSGKIGQGLKFDGTNRYVDAGSPSSLKITGAMTISTWVTLNVAGTNDVFVSKYGNAGQRSYMLYKGSDDSLQMLSSGDGTNIIQSGGSGVTWVPGVWYHIVGIYIPSTSLTTYRNGVQISQTTISVPASNFDSTTNVQIGQAVGYNNPHNGKLDDVRIYNRALSYQEIQALYLMGK